MAPRCCKKTRGLFSDFFDGELGPDKAKFVRSHLEECGSCRESYSSYEETFRMVRDLPSITVSDSFETRLNGTIRRAEERPKRSWWSDFARIPIPAPLGAAAILLLSIFAFNQYSLDPAPPAGDLTTLNRTSGNLSAPEGNTRPSFFPNLRMGGAGTLAGGLPYPLKDNTGRMGGFTFGPDRPDLILNEKSRAHRRGRGGDGCVEGPFPGMCWKVTSIKKIKAAPAAKDGETPADSSRHLDTTETH